MTDILCPLELPNPGRRGISRDERLFSFGIRDIARRVALAAVIRYRGEDLLLHMYLAGIYHAQDILNEGTQ